MQAIESAWGTGEAWGNFVGTFHLDYSHLFHCSVVSDQLLIFWQSPVRLGYCMEAGCLDKNNFFSKKNKPSYHFGLADKSPKDKHSSLISFALY
jgi:hypothetical protein